jgi:hypothetical protein
MPDLKEVAAGVDAMGNEHGGYNGLFDSVGVHRDPILRLAMTRAGAIAQQGIEAPQRLTSQATWIDGFLIGAKFAQRNNDE